MFAPLNHQLPTHALNILGHKEQVVQEVHLFCTSLEKYVLTTDQRNATGRTSPQDQEMMNMVNGISFKTFLKILETEVVDSRYTFGTTQCTHKS